MTTILRAAASAWGRWVAEYSRRAISPERLSVIGGDPVPKGTCIWVSWHEQNLIALALHKTVIKRPVAAFVPPGSTGDAMAGWLKGLDILPIPQSERACLWKMVKALEEGHDALLALDGPVGPRRIAKNGVLWLTAHANYEMRAVGFWASPAFRLPRWDRQIVPLPGANVTAAWATVKRALLLGDRNAALEYLNRQLDELSEQAIVSHKGMRS
jgi:lysophospholipid acyltransferase (LPLAT)-like uncharacterized protein